MDETDRHVSKKRKLDETIIVKKAVKSIETAENPDEKAKAIASLADIMASSDAQKQQVQVVVDSGGVACLVAAMCTHAASEKRVSPRMPGVDEHCVRVGCTQAGGCGCGRRGVCCGCDAHARRVRERV